LHSTFIQAIYIVQHNEEPEELDIEGRGGKPLDPRSRGDAESSPPFPPSPRRSWIEAGKAKWTAYKAKADAESAAKLAKAYLAEKDRVANRSEEEVENEKIARAEQAAQRKKDRDGKLADEIDNLVE
jgi:hypothetical protein